VLVRGAQARIAGQDRTRRRSSNGIPSIQCRGIRAGCPLPVNRDCNTREFYFDTRAREGREMRRRSCCAVFGRVWRVKINNVPWAMFACVCVESYVLSEEPVQADCHDEEETPSRSGKYIHVGDWSGTVMFNDVDMEESGGKRPWS
jgi:hypothetical protein